jgi:hypothetical protein
MATNAEIDVKINRGLLKKGFKLPQGSLLPTTTEGFLASAESMQITEQIAGLKMVLAKCKPLCPDYSKCPTDCVQDHDYCPDCGIPVGIKDASLYRSPDCYENREER